MLIRYLTFLVLLTGPVAAGHAEDWPQWRGPDGAGVWREAGVLSEIPAGGLKLVWRSPVGAGYASPIVAKGRVYLADTELVHPKARERLHCFDEATGKVLWTYVREVEYPDFAYTPSPGMGQTPTPIADDGLVYSIGSLGHLCCLDAATGEVRWKRDLVADYGAKEFNFNSSPVIEGDLLIVYVGGRHSIVALEKSTGKEIWAALDEQGTNSTPALITVGKTRQLIVWTQASVTSLTPTTGKTLWRIPLATTRDVAVSTPVASGDLLLIGGLALKLEADPPSASILWPASKAVSKRVLSNTSTALIQNGRVYSARSTGQLVCLDARTGDTVWETDKVTDIRNGAGIHLTPQGDGLFLYTERGELIRARFTAEGYKELGRARLLEPLYPFSGRKVAWSPPAYANRCVFVRNEKELVCYSVATER